MTEQQPPRPDPRTSRPRPKRLRQHTNPLAFQGATERPDWGAVLGGPPEELEIGFGLGELLLQRAALRPGSRICGIDVRWAYVERVREEAAQLPRPLKNLYFVHAEGKLALSKWLDPGTLKHVIVYFPDPWFKKRHAKRRIINPEVTSLIADRLAPGGLLHIATDQEPLAHAMMEIVSAEPRLRNVVGPGRFAPESALGAMSGREVEHIRRGERIWRLLFRRE
ncbi:MAG: tRNA (guanosine(46)-N7)-methyltransferase TrmB [Myxococcota bacterium]